MQKKLAIKVGMLSALAVGVSGFFMMYLLWKIIGSPQGLPGLFFYRAATIGDGICLPILIGASMTFLQYNKALHRHCSKISLIVAMAAGFSAIVVQMSWLVRDDILLNWSIPIQHHFNIAGWYHSLFFITMFGVIAYQLCEMWFVIREKQGEYSWFERVLLWLFTLSGALFISMFITDDYKQYCSMILLLTMTAVGISMLLVFYIKSASGKNHRVLLSAMLMGIVSAYSISLLITIPVQGDIAIALGGALCVCFLWRVELFSIGRLVYQDILTIIIYTCALYTISGINNVGELSLALLFLMVATVLIEKVYINEIRFRSSSFIAVGVYMIINCIPIEVINVDSLFEFAFLVIIYFLFKKEIMEYFSVVVNAEEIKNQNKINNEQFKKIKGKSYIQIVIGIVAIIILMFRWLLDIAISKGNKIELGSVNISIISIWLLIISIGALALFGITRIRKYVLVKAGTIFFSCFAFIILIKIVLGNIGIRHDLVWTPLKWIMLLCSICACIGAAILSAHGYYMNVVWLRGLKKKKYAFVMALIQFFGCLLLNMSITVLVLYQQTWKNLILVAFVTVIAFVLIPVLHGRVMQYEKKTFHVVGNQPLGGIAQDGLMISLIVLFAIYIPCTYISIINVRDLSTVTGGFTLICSAFPPIGYCLKNNVEHMERQRKVLADYPMEEDLWKTLHRCLVRQSMQTVFAMFPYVCVAVGAQILKRLGKSMTLQETIKDIVTTYIDKDVYGADKLKEENIVG